MACTAETKHDLPRITRHWRRLENAVVACRECGKLHYLRRFDSSESTSYSWKELRG